VFARAPTTLTVILDPDRNERAVSLPSQWEPSGNAQARRILDRAQAAMRRLQSVSQSELDSSVPGASALMRYTLQAPDRLAWTASALHPGQPPHFEDAQVQIGGQLWSHLPIAPGWRRQSIGSTLPFSVPTWFTWTTNAEMVRLLAAQPTHQRVVAKIALMDPGVPAWWTLRVDLARNRVLSARLITPGLSEADHFSRFDSAPPVVRPNGPRL
jgi:hypothetical protein